MCYLYYERIEGDTFCGEENYININEGIHLISAGNYLGQGKLDNTIHEITEEQIRELYFMNSEEMQTKKKVTESSYRGESDYGKYSLPVATYMEHIVRDRRTDGVLCQYPHGVVIKQSTTKDYYRGECQLYGESIPSIFRSMRVYDTILDQELYSMVCDMRIVEFMRLIKQFDHVQNWKVSDVLFDAIAQHYGLETRWLDITCDFKVALFFACCSWNQESRSWDYLINQDFKKTGREYGMIFHMPTWDMTTRWDCEIQRFYDLSKGLPGNLVYPLGFQPFMRCSAQSGYGIYMRKPLPLETDIGFEKLKFRQSEKLSKWIYDEMQGGKRIYPFEGLKGLENEIEQIRHLTEFSEEAFMYAIRRSHYFSVQDAPECRKKLAAFQVKGGKISVNKYFHLHVSNAKAKILNTLYQDFSVEEFYSIRLLERSVTDNKGNAAGAAMYEPWMLSADTHERGMKDFRPRKMVGYCSNIGLESYIHSLKILVTKDCRDF